MNSTSTDLNLSKVPMGPNLRGWLEISDSDYLGQDHLKQSDEVFTHFSNHLQSFLESKPFIDESELIDVLDELVAMNLPKAAVRLAEKSSGLWSGTNFRGELTLGVAHMLDESLDEAEKHFCAAQKILPEEPAPYANLVQILLFQGEIPEAKTWCLAALDVEPDNLGFWDLYGQVLTEEIGPHAGETLLKIAHEKSSWAGVLLGADMTQDADPSHKFRQLDPFYGKGVRDHTFLIEYTASLGMAGHYDRIPQIVWSAEQAASNGLPWQLFLHGAQAYIALNDKERTLKFLEKAKNCQHIPDDALQMIEELKRDPDQFVH